MPGPQSSGWHRSDQIPFAGFFLNVRGEMFGDLWPIELNGFEHEPEGIMFVVEAAYHVVGPELSERKTLYRASPVSAPSSML